MSKDKRRLRWLREGLAIASLVAIFVMSGTECAAMPAQRTEPGHPVVRTATELNPEGDPLVSGFANPPNSARPRVWWHWMNGNITTDGIDLDLEWMKRIGIGGFHTFDVSMNTPTIVDKRLLYMTPEWKIAFQHALTKAEAMGLEVTVASSPGWSETEITGDQPFRRSLALPPRSAGYFQDLGSVASSFHVALK